LNQNSREKVTIYLDKASKLLALYPNERLSVWLDVREAYLNLHYGNISKVSQLLLSAKAYYDGVDLGQLSIKDVYFKMLIFSGLGSVFTANGDSERSITAQLSVIKLCDAYGLRSRLSFHYVSLGTAYMANNEFESAEDYFIKALEVKDDVSQKARGSAYANLGYFHFQNKDFKSALEHYDRAEACFINNKGGNDDIANLSNIHQWRAQLYAEQKNEKVAIQYFMAAFNFSHQIHDYRQMSEIYKNLAAFHHSIGSHKEAYEAMLAHVENAERYAETVRERKTEELEVKYKAEQRTQEAKMLQLQASQLQMKALRAQMNPHFMFNALNAIQDYIGANDVKNAKLYLSKFGQLMRQILEYSELGVISLEEEIEFLKNYMEINEKLRFDDQLQSKFIIDPDIEEDIFGVPTMIIQPYIENAVEHGLRGRKNGIVMIRFMMHEENSIKCIIQDNGVGRRAARQNKISKGNYKAHKSRGTAITERRLQILNKDPKGTFVKTFDLANNGVPSGTRVELIIPIKDLK